MHLQPKTQSDRPRLAYASALAAGLLLLLLCISGCPGTAKAPAELRLSKDSAAGKVYPEGVFTPFDGVYPPEWPDYLTLPEGSYTLGPISDDEKANAADEQLQREMVAYALVPQDYVDIRLHYADVLKGQGYVLVGKLLYKKERMWNGESYVQRPDGLWYGVVVKPMSDTGLKGWTALTITVSLHLDLSGQWERAGGSIKSREEQGGEVKQEVDVGAGQSTDPGP